jgi:hypothetical protein
MLKITGRWTLALTMALTACDKGGGNGDDTMRQHGGVS